MSTNGQVLISEGKDFEIYLYQHFDAYDLPQTVKRALRKRWRWRDPEYLARIIFDEMIGDQQGNETGYGISTTPFGVNIEVIVDTTEQRVKVINNNNMEANLTFEEFIR